MEDADSIFMQEKLLTLFLHRKKLITQIGGSRWAATGRVVCILCCLHWLLITIKENKSIKLHTFLSQIKTATIATNLGK